MKRKLWLATIMILALVCVCAFAAAEDTEDDIILRLSEEQDGNVTWVGGDDGYISAPMHQWINFDVSAPGSNGVSIYWMDDPHEELEESQSLSSIAAPQEKFTDCWPGDNWESFTWTPNDLPDTEGYTGGDYIKYIIAEGIYGENWGTFKRVSVPVHVSVTEEIEAPVFTIPAINAPDGDGLVEISRGELFYVDVVNDPEVDFYGMYLLKDSINYDGEQQSDHYWEWIADSHWTPRSDGNTTRVSLSVPRCTPGNTYRVHVYAVKFGALQTEAIQPENVDVPVSLYIREENENPDLIVSMKDEFQIGEEIRPFVYYSNPDEIPVGWLDVQIHREGDEEIVYSTTGEFEDCWEVDGAIWSEGTYVVDVYVCWFADDGRHDVCHPNEKRFTVSGRRNPDLSIDWEAAQGQGYDYEIPVHTPFTVRINAYGADNIVLDMGNGREPVYANSFEEWHDGRWGEHHENISMDLWYDESCAKMGEDYPVFPMIAWAPSEFTDEGQQDPHSRTINILCTTDGTVDVDEWNPVLYQSTDENGNVFLSWHPGEGDWTEIDNDHPITIRRGRFLSIIDLADSLPDECTDAWGALLWDENWTDGVQSAEQMDADGGWITLSTARFATEDEGPVNACLNLAAWKEGYDSDSIYVPVTITGTQAQSDAVAEWFFTGADEDGNVSVQTHDRISFSVYAANADNMEVIGYNEDGDEVFHDGCDGNLYTCMFWTMDCGGTVTFKVSGTANDEEFEDEYNGHVIFGSKGPLPAPTVSLASNTIPKGEEISFQFAENGELFEDGVKKEEFADVEYNVYLWDNFSNLIHGINDATPGETISFGTEDLEPGWTYRVSVDIQKRGWDGVATDAWVLILPAEEKDNPEGYKISLTASGWNQDEDEELTGIISINKNMTFRVEAQKKVNAPETEVQYNPFNRF